MQRTLLLLISLSYVSSQFTKQTCHTVKDAYEASECCKNGSGDRTVPVEEFAIPTTECKMSTVFKDAYDASIKDIMDEYDVNTKIAYGSWGSSVLTFRVAKTSPCSLKAYWDKNDELLARFRPVYTALSSSTELLPNERTLLASMIDGLEAGGTWMGQRINDPRTPTGLRMHADVWGLEALWGSERTQSATLASVDDIGDAKEWMDSLVTYFDELKTMMETSVNFGYTYAKEVCDQLNKPLIVNDDLMWYFGKYNATAYGCTCTSSTGCSEFLEYRTATMNTLKEKIGAFKTFWSQTYMLECQHSAHAYKDLPATGTGRTLLNPSTQSPTCGTEPLFTKLCSVIGGNCVDPVSGIDFSINGILQLMYQTSVLDRTKTLSQIHDGFLSRFNTGLSETNTLYEAYLDTDFPIKFANASDAKAHMTLTDRSKWYTRKVIDVQKNFYCGDLSKCYNASDVDEMGLPTWKGCFDDDFDYADGVTVHTAEECEEFDLYEMRTRCPKRAAFKLGFEGMINEADNAVAAVTNGFYAGRGEYKTLTGCPFEWRVKFNSGYDTPYMSSGSEGSFDQCPDGSHSGMYMRQDGSDCFFHRNLGTVYHEAIIGHGYQIPAAVETVDPTLCKLESFSFRGRGTIAEGYAVYADTIIGNEMKLYEPPHVAPEPFIAGAGIDKKILGAICVVDMCLAMGTCTWTEATDFLLKSEYGTTSGAVRVVRSATTMGQSCTYDAGFLWASDRYHHYKEKIATELNQGFIGKDTLRIQYEHTLQKNGMAPFAVIDDALAKWWDTVDPSRRRLHEVSLKATEYTTTTSKPRPGRTTPPPRTLVR